jgi:hypothetical protein
MSLFCVRERIYKKKLLVGHLFGSCARLSVQLFAKTFFSGEKLKQKTHRNFGKERDKKKFIFFKKSFSSICEGKRDGVKQQVRVSILFEKGASPTRPS